VIAQRLRRRLLVPVASDHAAPGFLLGGRESLERVFKAKGN
jgi:hypothetical protein